MCAGKPLGLRAALTKGESRHTCAGGAERWEEALELPAGGAQGLSSPLKPWPPGWASASTGDHLSLPPFLS